MSDSKSNLTLYILAAIVFAIILALSVPAFAMEFKIGGEIFLRLLKMMVVPLVVASVMSGIIGLGDIRKLRRPGLYAIVYYLSTTLIAVTIGLVVVNVIQPGVGVVDESTLSSMAEQGSALISQNQDRIETMSIFDSLLLMLFTDNLILAAVETNLLPLIVFSIIFSGMLTTMGERVKSLTDMIVQVNDALLSFVMLLMRLAPLGIFCLVTARFGEAQAEGKFLEVISQTGQYVASVLTGLGLHALVVLPVLLWIFTRRNPLRFISNMSQALLTAFSTASSSATLPVTMECAIENANVSKRSVEFVMPLGATINMDGTALYEAVAAIFIAQAIGVDLSLTQQITVAITATLAAIGTAGIPEAGLITMIIVLNAVGLPVEYISLILSVDWLLDRFRTAVNCFGDSVGAAIVETSFDETDGALSSK